MAANRVLSLMQSLLDPREKNESVYHLASFDPGMGKTEVICRFIEQWRRDDFEPSGGMLICLGTHKEIEGLIDRAELRGDQFSVVVGAGVRLRSNGNQNRADAPVMIITHEKLRRLTNGKRYEDVKELYFQGAPRRLRVWDEAFLPGRVGSIRLDRLTGLLEPLRPVCPEAADCLESFCATAKISSEILVPASIKTVSAGISRLSGDAYADISEMLDKWCNRTVCVQPYNGRGVCLIEAEGGIPDDFAPALIFDASGRVRELYGIMETAGRLVRVETLDGARNYRNLTIRHLNQSASRSTLSDRNKRIEMLQYAADIIHKYPVGEEWLIVRPKERFGEYSIDQELSEMVSSPARLRWLHWGNHHGTNEFHKISHVLVIGMMYLPQEVLASLHLAAGGSASHLDDKDFYPSMQESEHRHNLLQGVCRCAIRNSGADGEGAPCVTYIMGRLGPDPTRQLTQIFPGAHVAVWTPENQALKGAARRTANALQLLLRQSLTISKKDLREALGVGSEALRKVVKQLPFRAWLQRSGISEGKFNFELDPAVDCAATVAA